MLDVFFGFLSLVLVVGGVFCASETRSYTDEQQARAPRLWRAYAASGAFCCLVGVGSLAWLLTGGTVWAVSGIASLTAALPCFVQALYHRTADIDRSPLSEQLAELVARKLNFPDPTQRA
ncbi:hypothetical protein Htur_5192 (plasmid) [Haloterrigena turkmenica DSM 5511]|uniref:Uncharacterized protein n=1 Tax=Haloterrigena turkmenica (strain ATCC 51198 / DSM 5511 / JCM 9101 / NCIMB 13204 / VKM B-1734 / 4k) TaxID=543526 RepID=D2S376_HALTV|nr:hypothetical protein [Haloterrigena turkmenica]ADB63823.1 hypothetical protein Htur_5192 [Haloterrigena turkmenica DSM 5511]